jgi:hypothetical protein
MKDIPLTQEELLFLTDLMMGCPLGLTKQISLNNSVDDVKLFNYLLSYVDEDKHYHD